MVGIGLALVWVVLFVVSFGILIIIKNQTDQTKLRVIVPLFLAIWIVSPILMFFAASEVKEEARQELEQCQEVCMTAEAEARQELEQCQEALMTAEARQDLTMEKRRNPNFPFTHQ